MLDPWIIEEIRRREEEHRQRDERSRVEIHIETPNDSLDRSSGRPAPAPRGTPGGSTDRGVTIIDFSV